MADFAIVAQSDGSWLATSHRDTILAAPVNAVIFAESRQDARLKLDAMYPANHPKLTRVHGVWLDYSNYRTTTDDLRNDDKFLVYPVDSSHYVWNGNTEELIQLVKECQVVLVDNYNLSRWGISSLREDLRNAGIVVKPGAMPRYSRARPECWHELRWNPRGVKAALKGRATKARNAKAAKPPPDTHWLRDANYALIAVLDAHNFNMHSVSCSDGHTNALDVAYNVMVFNTIFGCNAHRRVSAFQKLVRAWPTCFWRNALYKTVKSNFMNSSYASDKRTGRQYLRALHWLDAECKQKMPRACKRFKPAIRLFELTITKRGSNGKKAKRAPARSKKARVPKQKGKAKKG